MIGCLFAQFTLYNDSGTYLDQSRYNELSCVSVGSFKKFHPEIDVHHVTDQTIQEYINNYLPGIELVNNVGILRYMIARGLMEKLGYKKMIILGCDTITCARFDEFINHEHDILATLNYPCQEHTQYWTTPYVEYSFGLFDHMNVNADVVAFNGVKGLSKIIDVSIEHYSTFAEQGGLNEVIINAKEHDITYKIIDFPYPTSDVVYNARSKGVYGTDMIWKGVLHKSGNLNGSQSPTRMFYVKNKKLYTADHKHIKCFHIIEALGLRTDTEYNECINDIKKNWFNKETVQFFKEECNCSCFFD